MTALADLRWIARQASLLSLGILVFTLAGCDNRPPATPPAEEPEVAQAASAARDLPDLQQRLDDRKAEFLERAPADMAAAFDRGIEELREQSVAARSLQVGEHAPDFKLPAAGGGEVALYELLEDGPVVLAWYRGGWCPYCIIELDAYDEARPAVEAAGGQIVAVSPEKPEKAAQTKQQHNLGYPVLSDIGNTVAAEFGIAYTLPQVVQEKFAGRVDLAEYNADTSARLPLSATYVIDTDGVVRYAFLEEDYKRRAQPADIVAALEEIKHGD